MGKALMTAKLTINTLIVALTFTSCCAACPIDPNAPASCESARPDPVEAVLRNLEKAAADLKTYQAKIEYLVQEPEYETQKLRKGRLFYAKDPNRSSLRVNFETLKIDDQHPQPELEHYIFDGVWLTQIKYELKQARRSQQTEPNKPRDPFELLSSRFPRHRLHKRRRLTKAFRNHPRRSPRRPKRYTHAAPTQSQTRLQIRRRLHRNGLLAKR